MQEILAWMESTDLARFILETTWVFPTLETLHFLGLILLIGSIYVVDLRLLGIGSVAPVSDIMRFVPVSLVGFGINVGTGIMFLFADPFRYYPNLSFRLKMLAIVIAGLNLLWFKYALHPKIHAADDTFPVATARTIALISLVMWTSVIVLGRIIPYIE
jgi:hypothetical protein